MRPAEGRSRPPSRASRVDLPPPDGPVIATNSPGATSNETLSSAATVTSPDLNTRLTSSARIPSGWPSRSQVSPLTDAAGRAGRDSGASSSSGSGAAPGAACGAAGPGSRGGGAGAGGTGGGGGGGKAGGRPAPGSGGLVT